MQTSGKAARITRMGVLKMIECFVSYYRTEYPYCREGYENDYDKIELQKSKFCFSSFCVDCETRRPYCNWAWCNSYPYTCLTEPCPEKKRILHCRCSIGLLEDEDIEIFKQESGIADSPDYVLHEGISRNTKHEHFNHQQLIDQFKEDSNRGTLHDGWSILPPTPFGHVVRMQKFRDIAKKIIAAPADPTPRLMPMIKKKQESPASDRTTYNKESFKKIMESPVEWTDNTIIEAVNPVEREALGEAIGRHTAKWLLKADMANTHKELQEEILSDMGFLPIEVTDKLYPNANPDDRRGISQRISRQNKERTKEQK